eukprot:4638002-Karenia_brevis.AAC.1
MKLVLLEAIAFEPLHFAVNYAGSFVLIEALKCKEIVEVADGNILSILLDHCDDLMESQCGRRVIMALHT